MEAMVLREFGSEFVQERRPIPEPGSGEVRVRVIGVGAGLTLEHARTGRMGGETPRVLGHELSGTVDALGPGVTGWTLRAPVTASFYLLCGRCEWCASGREMLCSDFGGFVGTAIDGAFAEYVVLPAHNLVAIPDGVHVAHAGVVADAVATAYHAVTKRIRLVAGQTVAVIGAGGGLGVHVLQMVRAFGGSAVAVERDGDKAAELERRGLAETVLHASDGNWAAGARVDAVVDTVGSSETLAAAIEALGRAGTFVALGYDPAARLEVDPFRLIAEEVVVTGTRYATRAEIARSLELVRQGRVELVVGATFPLAQLNDAFAAIAQNGVLGRIVIDIAEEG